jgi:uncharacterized protein YvpB
MNYSFSVLGRIVSVGALVVAATPAQAQQVKVPIEFHRQEHSLSCEVATLKMALATHGITMSETELITALPFDPTPKRPGIWGDPNQGFVGSIDGRMLRTGYGVYWDPIAKLGNRYAHTDVLRHGSASQLAGHVAEGNPVIIWGYYGSGAAHTWQTERGTAINAIDGEHTRVVYGFDGPHHAPTHFYLMDPSAGRLIWTTEKLMQNWSSLNHMGVVVSPRWVRTLGDTRIWEISADGTARHLVTSWAAFLRRGGIGAAVVTIDAQKIVRYKIGPAIL